VSARPLARSSAPCSRSINPGHNARKVAQAVTSARPYSATGWQLALLFKPKDRGAMDTKNSCRLSQWHKPIALGWLWSLLGSFHGLDDLGYLSGNGVFDGGLDSLRNWIAHSDTP
jgi:hypothetical protein